MKAIRVHSFGPPDVMKIEDVSELLPGPGEVVVAVQAAGVNPVDTYIRSGLYRPDLKLPYTPGIDAAGVIVAIGVPYGAAFRALFQRAGAQAGESVLVHGASGAVGIAARGLI